MRSANGARRLSLAVRRLVRAVAVLGYLSAIGTMVLALRHGVKEADPVGSVVGAMLAAFAGLMTYADQHGNKSTAVATVTAADMEAIRAEVLTVREEEAADRGLQNLGGKLLPLTVGDQGLPSSAPEPAVAAPAGTGADRLALAMAAPAPVGERPDLLWDHQQFAAVWARFVMSRHQRRADGTTERPVRLAVHGIGGVGKTTLALLLTLGLLRWKAAGQSGVCTDSSTPVPLLISLSGYDGRTELVRWLNRKARRLYPSLDRIQAGPNDEHGPVGRLLNEGRAILILDGWDEMRSAAKARAAADLARFIRGNWHLIILSRAETSGEVANRLGALHGEMDIVDVKLPDLAQRQAYLRHRAAVGRGQNDVWHTASIMRLADDMNVVTALHEVLATPMMLDLAARAIGVGETTVEALKQMALRGTKATRAWLLRLHVQWATSPTRRSPQRLLSNPRSKMWLTYLARIMVETKTHQLSWWRTAGRPPERPFAAAAAMSVLPAYWLALQMPVGLTRGLAIGCGVGVGAAFLRSRPIGWLTAVAVFATIAGSVQLVGTIMLGWEQATADALEIASSVTAAYLILDTLLKSRWPLRITRPAWIVRSAGRVVGAGRWIGQRSARLTRHVPARPARTAREGRSWLGPRLRRLLPPVTATVLAGFVGALPPVLFRLLSGFADKERSPLMVYVGVTFGIGLAVIAARSYITKDETVPDQVRFTGRERTEPWYLSVLVAMLFATSIGAGGAIGGWMRYTGSYAVAVGVVFLFVAGFPVGIVGGSVKWLCRPLRQSTTGVPTSSPSEPTAASTAPVKGDSGAPSPADDDEDEDFGRPETAVTMRADRWLAILIYGGILVLSAISIWALNRGLPEIPAAIRNDSPSRYAVGPEDSVLVMSTLGTIVAATFTVWPMFVIAHLWRVAHGMLPWRLRRFAIELQRSRIIIRDGDTYKFRYAGLRSYLGEELYEELRVRPSPRGTGGRSYGRRRPACPGPRSGR
jgi:hypothetical protein